MIMIRFSSVICLLAVCVFMIFSASSAYSYSGAQTTCLRADPPPTIDGTVSPGEWGEGIYIDKSVTLKGDANYNGYGNCYQPEFITDANDISGTIYCLWDDQNLYLAVEVTDDDFVFENGGGWDNDCAEIRFSPDGASIVGLWITPSLSSGGPGWYRNNELNGATTTEEAPLINATIGANGYEWELALPLDHEAIAGLDPSVGKVVGYTVSLGDHDVGGAEYSMPCWSLNPDSWGWDIPFWGEITFSGEVLAALSPCGKLASTWSFVKTR
jgi:hypothetical protein